MLILLIMWLIFLYTIICIYYSYLTILYTQLLYYAFVYIYVCVRVYRYLKSISPITLLVIDVLSPTGLYSHLGLHEALEIVDQLTPVRTLFTGMACTLGDHDEVGQNYDTFDVLSYRLYFISCLSCFICVPRTYMYASKCLCVISYIYSMCSEL